MKSAEIFVEMINRIDPLKSKGGFGMGFFRIWGFLSQVLGIFQNLGIFIPGIGNFLKSGDFYPRGFGIFMPDIGDFYPPLPTK